MILIADNGSTSLNWVYISNTGDIKKVVDVGYNPNYSDISVFENHIKKLKSEHTFSPEEVYFYSTGVGNKISYEKVFNTLCTVFSSSKVFVETDLTGAARAALGHDSGIVAILGTGANAGYYNHPAIINQPLSLGYLFGDEGSGAYIGKMFLKALLEKKISQELCDILYHDLNTDADSILHEIYNTAKPAFFFASFLPLLKKYISNSEIQNIIKQSFQDFFNSIVSRIDTQNNKTISFIGSVAYNFSTQLKDVCNKNGFSLHSVNSSPINGLIKYHSSHK